MTDTEILNWLEARTPQIRLYVRLVILDTDGRQFHAPTLREAVCEASRAMPPRKDPFVF